MWDTTVLSLVSKHCVLLVRRQLEDEAEGKDGDAVQPVTASRQPDTLTVVKRVSRSVSLLARRTVFCVV